MQKKTTARLRKTFHYPDDNDSDDSLPEVLDEQEQSHLITSLSTTNALQNLQFSRLLLAIPLLSIIPYIPILFAHIRPNTLAPDSTNRASLFSLLSITSLLSTAWLLWVLPPEKTGITLLDDLHSRSRPERPVARDAQRYQAPEFDPRNFLQSQPSDSGPLLHYLPLLNVGLCVVLVVLGIVTTRPPDGIDYGDHGQVVLWWGFSWLPGFVYAVVLVAKCVMGSVDPEVELGGLKYRYKGA